MSEVVVKYVSDNIDIVLGKMAIGRVISGEYVLGELNIALADIEEDADSAFIQFEPQWDDPEDEYTLNLSVYQRRCEHCDEIFTRTITKDDIEYMIEKNYSTRTKFVRYSEIIPHFRYSRTPENMNVNWRGKNEVAISVSENVVSCVEVYFVVLNEENEEEELSINIDTGFAY